MACAEGYPGWGSGGGWVAGGPAPRSQRERSNESKTAYRSGSTIGGCPAAFRFALSAARSTVVSAVHAQRLLCLGRVGRVGPDKRPSHTPPRWREVRSNLPPLRRTRAGVSALPARRPDWGFGVILRVCQSSRCSSASWSECSTRSTNRRISMRHFDTQPLRRAGAGVASLTVQVSEVPLPVGDQSTSGAGKGR